MSAGKRNSSVVAVAGWRVLERAGSGCRGTVYMAERDGRRAALKVLHPHTRLERSPLERLVPSAEPSVRHPNINPVLEVGEADGQRYYVARWLYGDPLWRVLEDLAAGATSRPSLSPLSPGADGHHHPEYFRHVARVCADVADGLEAAHANGICHLHLSPRNLVFAPSGRLVITDLGGGRHDGPPPSEVDGDGPSDSSYARSLAYRAPEQYLSPLDEGIPATDIYALGAILFELVTLRPFLDTSNPNDARKLVLRRKVPRPRDLRRDTPPLLEACMLRALELRTNYRYGSAALFASDLRRFADGESVTGSRVHRYQKRIFDEGQWPRRRLVAGAVLLAIVATAYFGVRQVEQDTERSARHATANRFLRAGRYSEARRESDRLLLLDPGDPAAEGIRERAAAGAAAERLAVAMKKFSAEDRTSALAELDDARSLLPEDPWFDRLHREMLAHIARHPLDRLLGHHDADLRRAGLLRLSEEIEGGTRPVAEAARALTHLGDPDTTVRDAAFTVLARAPSSAPILRALCLSVADGPVLAEQPIATMEASDFLRLQQTLAAIDDRPARELLCRWTVDQMHMLDSASAGEAVVVDGPLEVISSGAVFPSFTENWVRIAATLDPDRLLDAMELLRKSPRISLETVVDALETCGSADAAEALRALARAEYLRVGIPALESLGRLGRDDLLLDLAGASLPMELRLRALELAAERRRPAVREKLALLVGTSPEPQIRRRAFDLLRALPTVEMDTKASILCWAVADPDLREGAWEWLEASAPRDREAVLVSLMGHSHAATRRRAATLLGQLGPTGDPGTLVDVGLKIFSKDAAVRRSAITVLRNAEMAKVRTGVGRSVGRTVRTSLKVHTLSAIEALRGRLRRALEPAIAAFQKARARFGL